MSEPVAERVKRYILDGSDADLRRLLGIAQVSEKAARSAFTVVGVADGWHAIECGCGPIGALPVLSEMVGPSGRVTGVDFVQSTVDRARSVVVELGLDNVEVLVADINSPEFTTVSGTPFDLAYTRCFLMHQRDLTGTLSQIADVLRPGGWLVAHEPMRTPPPRSHPELEALASYWELIHKVIEATGARSRTVDELPAAMRAAGLEVVREAGFFDPLGPGVGFELHAATAAAAKDRAVEAGLASRAEVDDLVSELRAAVDGPYEWVTTPFYLDVTARTKFAHPAN